MAFAVECDVKFRPDGPCPKCGCHPAWCGPRYESAFAGAPEQLRWWCSDCHYDTTTPCLDASDEEEQAVRVNHHPQCQTGSDGHSDYCVKACRVWQLTAEYAGWSPPKHPIEGIRIGERVEVAGAPGEVVALDFDALRVTVELNDG